MIILPDNSNSLVHVSFTAYTMIHLQSSVECTYNSGTSTKGLPEMRTFDVCINDKFCNLNRILFTCKSSTYLCNSKITECPLHIDQDCNISNALTCWLYMMDNCTVQLVVSS